MLIIIFKIVLGFSSLIVVKVKFMRNIWCTGFENGSFVPQKV